MKQNPLNFIIQKGTELGVQKFIPILSERTIVREINITRVKKIIVEASEQSNRISVPEINNLETLKNFLSKFPKNGYLLFCDINCEKNNLKNIFKLTYKNIILKKTLIQSGSKLYVNEFLKFENESPSDLIEIHNRPNYFHLIIFCKRQVSLFLHMSVCKLQF